MRFNFPVFGTQAPAVIGLDISSSSVKMVELARHGKEAYRLERYLIEMLPKDAVADGNIVNLEATVETVKRAWKKLGSSTRQVALALPTATVISKKIMVQAGLREDELELQVESEANQYIPFALDEVALDFQVLSSTPSDDGEIEVLIAASRKEKIEDRVAVAEAAGLKPIIMDVESYAVLSAFDLVKKKIPGGTQGKIIALIDIGANVTNLTVLRDDQALYVREQAFGGNQLTQDIARLYSMSFEEAEAAKRAQRLPDSYTTELLNPYLENMALETSRALQFFFTSTQFSQIDLIILVGGAISPGADQAIATRTQIKTMVANPFAEMSISDRIRSRNILTDAPSLMVACGLALRRFDA
ncbi:MAG: pilus assembly protein PilM [Pseudomonadota bacterium]